MMIHVMVISCQMHDVCIAFREYRNLSFESLLWYYVSCNILFGISSMERGTVCGTLENREDLDRQGFPNISKT